MFLAQRSQLEMEESTGSIDKTKVPKVVKLVQSNTKPVRTKNDKIENLAKKYIECKINISD